MKKAFLAAVSALTMISVGHASIAQTKVATEAAQALSKSELGQKAMKEYLNLSAGQITPELIASQISKAGSGPAIADAMALLTMKLKNNVSPEIAVKQVFGDANGNLLAVNKLAANVTTQATKVGVTFQAKADNNKPQVNSSSLASLVEKSNLPPRLAQQALATGDILSDNAFTGAGCDQLATFDTVPRYTWFAGRVAFAHLDKSRTKKENAQIALAEAKNAVRKNAADPDVLSEPMPSAEQIAAQASAIDGLESSKCHLVVTQ